MTKLEKAAAIEKAKMRKAEQKLSHKLDTAIVEATNLEQRIDAALEMVTQEPVAIVTGYYGGRLTVTPFNLASTLPTGMALYTAPQPISQDPVAWMHKCGDVCSAYDKEHMFGLDYFNIPLYAAPVRTKDLTDDEAQKLWNDTSSIVPMWAHHLHFARAVIAADRRKNK